MLFSICIPTYNRAYILPEAIKSVLDQTYKDFELVIIYDGSTDNTESIVRGFDDKRIIYLKKDKGGIHTALNMAFDHLRGDLFIKIDSDDKLRNDALELLSKEWEMIKNDPKCCGIIGRCISDGKIVGRPFEQENINYVDFHYGRHGGEYLDCCDCIRTDVLTKYRWPEDKNTKFIPEAYVMDYIGMHYYMKCSDLILQEKVYGSDGITKNNLDYQQKNCVGYLYNAVSKIDDIFPGVKVDYKKKFIFWVTYWRLVGFDHESKGPRVNKISFTGYIAKIFERLTEKRYG